MGNRSLEQRRVLILAERKGLSIAPVTFELLGMGKKIATSLKGTLCVTILGYEIAGVSEEVVHFADEVYCLDHTLLESFRPELYTSALEQLCRNVNPIAVLMSGTLNNLDMAPRLAYEMGVEVVTDCIDLTIEPETGYLLCAKPVYGAKVIATFILKKKTNLIMLRPKVAMQIEPGAIEGEIIHFDPVIDKSMVKVELIERIKEETISLDKAEAVVAGGRGIRNAEGLELLKELLEVLKKYFNRVELGASRPLVDMGLVPSSRQIGLTGEKIAPELYVAIGISGSLQHLTGIQGAKKIIAINNAPEAYIFEVADYGVIGNFEEVVPALRKKLEELK